MDEPDLTDDLDSRNLLPVQFRDNWIAIPKDFPYQVFLVGVLLGGMLSLAAVAVALGLRELHWWGGLLLILSYAQSLLPWPGKKANLDLEDYFSSTGEGMQSRE